MAASMQRRGGEVDCEVAEAAFFSFRLAVAHTLGGRRGVTWYGWITAQSPRTDRATCVEASVRPV
jgi:hypothetical protein